MATCHMQLKYERMYHWLTQKKKPYMKHNSLILYFISRNSQFVILLDGLYLCLHVSTIHLFAFLSEAAHYSDIL